MSSMSQKFYLPVRAVVFFICAASLLLWLTAQFVRTGSDFRQDLGNIKVSSEVNNTLNDLITASNKLSIAYRYYMLLDTKLGLENYQSQREDIVRLQSKLLLLSSREDWQAEAEELIKELGVLEQQFDADIARRQIIDNPNVDSIMRNIAFEIEILDDLNALEEKLQNRFYAQQEEIFETKDRATDQWLLLILTALVVLATVVFWLGRSMAAANSNARRAEQAEADKGRFMNYLVHDLRSPLNSIINFADITQREAFGPNNPKYREYAADIYHASMHMLQLVNNLLDHAKLRAGMLQLKPKPLLPAVELEQATHILRGLMEQKKIQLEWSGDHGIMVEADPEAMQRMLTNLLSNAIKFSPTGGKIIFGLEKITTPDPGQAKVRVAIIDEGPGIKTDDFKKIGQDFQQLAPANGDQPTGSGLGLSLVANLAAKQGGVLELKPAPGRGTIAALVLPQAAA